MDNDKLNALVGETDARVWADAFCELMDEKPAIAKDPETMLGWFANAIMSGWDSKAAADAGNRQPQVMRCGWFGFEGFGRPYEGWAPRPGVYQGSATAGRAFTYKRALRKARKLQKDMENPNWPGRSRHEGSGTVTGMKMPSTRKDS